jgi:hypothetical protein
MPDNGGAKRRIDLEAEPACILSPSVRISIELLIGIVSGRNAKPGAERTGLVISPRGETKT